MTLIKDRTIWRNNGNAVRAQGTYSSLTLITIVLVHCLNFFCRVAQFGMVLCVWSAAFRLRSVKENRYYRTGVAKQISQRSVLDLFGCIVIVDKCKSCHSLTPFQIVRRLTFLDILLLYYVSRASIYLSI